VYVGHAALALLVKHRAPRLPLTLLIPASFGPDWVQWVFEAAGHENRQLSHSLVAVFIGAIGLALLYGRVASASRDEALLLAALWASHWPADLITGIKPTWPGGPDIGLNVYERPLLDALIETVVVIGCWMLYRRSLPQTSRRRWGPLLIPAALIAVQVTFDVLQYTRDDPLLHRFDRPHFLR
jgi:hypothetical protein